MPTAARGRSRPARRSSGWRRCSTSTERAPTYLAVDLGAESGRVVAGTLAGDRVELREVHRFANDPVRLPDGLHWNLLSILREVLDGIGRAAGESAVSGVGVATWGVDYGLLDGAGRLLGLPYHYRDRRTEGMIERADELVGREELYRTTGIQTLPINTVYQLLADRGSPALEAAERIALVPDLLAYWLSGELANEITAASTTGLLDARRGEWAWGVIERLGLPARIFGPLTEPGTVIGRLASAHTRATRIPDAVPVFAVAGHDTASAFAATPLAPGEDAAILSSGTWSLLGVERDEPALDRRAAAFNLTNERGIDGTIRLLRNVMGLWLVQECRRAWASGYAGGPSYEELGRLAEEAAPEVPLFDPDLDELLAPDDMPSAIAAACQRAGQRPPSGRGELVRSILTSLACKYRLVLERLEAVSGRTLGAIRVVGGGARNDLLCRLTADVSGRPVIAGPTEATALGNVLVQARGDGRLGSLAEMREVAARTANPTTYEPSSDRGRWDDLYVRFVELTGLAAAPAPTTT